MRFDGRWSAAYPVSMASLLARIEARRRALAADAERYDRLRRLHVEIASRIELDPVAGASLLERANERVKHWADAKTCSPFYIRAWRRILRSHPEVGLRQLVRGKGQMRDAMLQNSPFSFAWTDERLSDRTE